MCQQEKAREILFQLENCKPSESFSKLDLSKAGMQRVLMFLYRKKECVTAGDISHSLQVSTARVAVLLKTLEKKKFIKKSQYVNDARKTMITLSDEGLTACEKLHEEIILQMSKIIDQIGEEKIETFLKTAQEICQVIENK